MWFVDKNRSSMTDETCVRVEFRLTGRADRVALGEKTAPAEGGEDNHRAIRPHHNPGRVNLLLAALGVTDWANSVLVEFFLGLYSRAKNINLPFKRGLGSFRVHGFPVHARTVAQAFARGQIGI